MAGILTVIQADITKLAVDAIVNAANEGLLAGGGVCGAIFRDAGSGLAEACRKVAPCPTGEARITPGFALPARFIIHAVGPVWNGGRSEEDALLAACYRNAIELAATHGLARIAFPPSRPASTASRPTERRPSPCARRSQCCVHIHPLPK